MPEINDPFTLSEDESSTEPKFPMTFWLKASTIKRLEQVKREAARVHPKTVKKIIASIKSAIEHEVERLEKIAPKNEK